MKPPQRQSSQPPAPQSHQIIAASSWHGPLPDPGSLRQFKDIIPDAPQIIFNQFVEQGRHQRWLEKCGSALDFIVALAAVLIILAFALAAFVFFWRGNNVAGAAFMATPVIVALVKMIRARK